MGPVQPWTLESLHVTQELVRSIVADLLHARAGSVDAAIDAGLERLATHLGADRAYVFVIDDAQQQMSNTHEWCADGVTAQITLMQQQPLSLIRAWLPDLHRGRPVEIADVDALPDERARGRELLREQGVRSLVVVPMNSLGELVGFVGFDVVSGLRTFHDTEINLLRSLADGVSAVLVHRRMDAEAARLQRQLAALSRHSLDMIVVMDETGRASYRSRSWQDLVVARGDAPASRLVHPEDLPAARALLAAVVELGDGGWLPTGDIRILAQDGTWRWCTGTMANHVGDPAVGGIVLNLTDVTERKRHEEQLAHDALHDPLTGLGNRILLTDRLDHACERAAMTGAGVGVLFLDIDRFKLINDSLGHGAGDQLLVALAERLQERVGPADTLARFGGDEFVVLSETVANSLELAGLAAHLQDGLVTPLRVGDRELRVTASIGLAWGRGESLSGVRLLADADTAMYRAKQDGRNRVSVFDTAMRTDVVRRTHVLQRLQRAIARGEVVAHYQPLVDLGTGRFVGAEALARWTDSELGPVSPAEFIPMAEDAGMIDELTASVVAQAVRDVESWPASMHVSVNLSASLLSSPQTAGHILSLVEDAGLPGDRLCIEVTETSVMADPDAAIRTLRLLRTAGIRIAMDDFGTGYSSLGMLRRLPIDVLKIDRSFVDGVDGDVRDRRLVEAVVSVAADFGMSSLAEGIETESQRRTLHEIGCAEAQGYLFARPMPADDLKVLLDSS